VPPGLRDLHKKDNPENTGFYYTSAFVCGIGYVWRDKNDTNKNVWIRPGDHALSSNVSANNQRAKGFGVETTATNAKRGFAVALLLFQLFVDCDRLLVADPVLLLGLLCESYYRRLFLV